MKKSKHIKQLLLLTAIAVGFAACKKNDPEPQPVPVETVSLSIEDLKKLSTTASVTINEENKVFRIKGIVISDKDIKNIDAKTVVLQEGDGKPGIIINFAAAHNFALGDEVQVGVSNQKLEKVNGEIVLNAIAVDSAKTISTGKTITARETGIADIKTNASTWNGTLVSINATELSSISGKYTGTLGVKDASGELTSTVVAGATFENTDLPASVSKITGIVRQNGIDVFIQIRKPEDIVAGDINEIITLDFSKDVWIDGFYGYKPANIPTFDSDFTNASIAYVYAFNGDRSADFNILGTNDGVVKEGLKTITVTFAGSKIAGDFSYSVINSTFPGSTIGQFDLAAFDANKDYFQIELLAFQWGNPIPLNKVSEVYKEDGKFFKVTFEAPTAAELATGGADDDFKTNPVYAIRNISKRTNAADKPAYQKTFAPILIEKIELGY